MTLNTSQRFAGTAVAKDMMSAVVKLAREIEELTSDVIEYGMVPHVTAHSHNELWRAIVLLSL